MQYDVIQPEIKFDYLGYDTIKLQQINQTLIQGKET